MWPGTWGSEGGREEERSGGRSSWSLGPGLQGVRWRRGRSQNRAADCRFQSSAHLQGSGQVLTEVGASGAPGGSGGCRGSEPGRSLRRLPLPPRRPSLQSRAQGIPARRPKPVCYIFHSFKTTQLLPALYCSLPRRPGPHLPLPASPSQPAPPGPRGCPLLPPGGSMRPWEAG